MLTVTVTIPLVVGDIIQLNALGQSIVLLTLTLETMFRQRRNTGYSPGSRRNTVRLEL